MSLKKKKDIILFISYSASDSIGCRVLGSRMARLSGDSDLIAFHTNLPSLISDSYGEDLHDILINSITRLQ